ncbi:DeoR/GlpR family DNA-binding transcription regulator [Nitrincola sp. MINF-07-Sa-05]|uniref:DeoR/GlpR family DNA-binding transcription regulator n=1 Tax=Nitrincola salilacus TaxID=3400273 RepID=UPI003918442A
MSASERRQQIVVLINQSGRQSLEQLAERFNVSVQTIRTDIRVLADRGLLMRRHGVAAPFPGRENVDFDQRQIVNRSGKRVIAEQCLELISDYQSLFLGTGTTVEHLADLLNLRKGIRVMTNNIHAATRLCHHPDCELIIAGGLVRKRDQDVVGGDALQFFSRFRVDIGIVSVGGMSRHGQLYDFNTDEVMAREALLLNARQKVLLLDSAKFDTEACCSAGHLTDYDIVVMDQPPGASLRSELSAAGVRLIC